MIIKFLLKSHKLLKQPKWKLSQILYKLLKIIKDNTHLKMNHHLLITVLIIVC
jgi:hypothetical protein